jgi:CBS domain-containing protein
VEDSDLAAFLAEHPPFDSLDLDALASCVRAAQLAHYRAGELILDAFVTVTDEVFVVVSGTVFLWNGADRVDEEPDERLGAGDLFGFSAMLTERSVGPRAVAAGPVVAARIPAGAVAPAFASRRGARYLAEKVSSASRRFAGAPSYSLVDELIVAQPLVVLPTTEAGAVARLMSEREVACAVVDLGHGRLGLVTDLVLRERLLVEGLPLTTPVQEVMHPSAPTALVGDSAAEASILMFDSGAEFLPVVDRDQRVRGVVGPRDFAVSSTTAGVSLHEQLRRAATIEELNVRARRVPAMLADLLSRGLASTKVIAVYSAIVDTVVRRAITLIFARHPELSVDAFTWLSLGSNGRREAVLSSDVDSAVAFDDRVPAEAITGYRAAFGEVNALLAKAGLSSDDHGATAQRPLFARTNADWRVAAHQWLASPVENKGAVMTSLLVDGRPIHGDPGLPAVTRVFGDLRRHPGTMRLLLEESLSARARLRSVRDVLTRRADTFDVKTQALLPIVNIARWAALSVQSAVLPTTERLRSAAGSAMLPAEQASILIEAFEVLQRLRLRYQLLQHQRGDRPSDVFVLDRMSPIDRSVITQCVREISSVQRRMDNIAVYVPAEAWAAPESS